MENLHPAYALFNLCLTDRSLVEEIDARISLNWVDNLLLRKCFEILIQSHKEGYIIDVPSLRHRMQHHCVLSEFDNLVGITFSLPVSIDALETHLQQLEDLYRSNQMQTGLAVIADSLRSGGCCDDALQENSRLLTKLEKKTQTGAAQLTVCVDESLVAMNEWVNGGGPKGMITGFQNLDDNLSGLRPKDYVIVAARPSMGKTTFSLSMMLSNTFQSDLPALFFSLEMSRDSLGENAMANLAQIPLDSLRNGCLTEHQWSKYHEVAKNLDQYNFLIDDDSITVEELCRRARAVHRAHGGLKGVLIDYLQLLTTKSISSENRNLEISEISRQLKALSKELGCPVIALSQLNRSLEQRSDKRPINSDLRDSGSLEQDADIILFLYRDAAYYEKADPELGEVIVGKARKARKGSYHIRFQGRYCRFVDFDDGFKPESFCDTSSTNSEEKEPSQRSFQEMYSPDPQPGPKTPVACGSKQNSPIRFINNEN
ncbi:replicative DNA helicase [Vibrio owensii]|uniref:replicative DNA helicase n=1 Tax=Vibrio owensii TaxID=696485 RepID=UPI0040689359